MEKWERNAWIDIPMDTNRIVGEKMGQNMEFCYEAKGRMTAGGD